MACVGAIVWGSLELNSDTSLASLHCRCHKKQRVFHLSDIRGINMTLSQCSALYFNDFYFLAAVHVNMPVDYRKYPVIGTNTRTTWNLTAHAAKILNGKDLVCIFKFD